MQEQYLGRLTPDMNVCDIEGKRSGRSPASIVTNSRPRSSRSRDLLKA